jgi:SpoVK/Ycf46/Vps4 family AAA+-type ATPase
MIIETGLEPTRTALFTGPPGVGKTMAARWVARMLKRPLVVLDLAAVMSSYLGRTGTNLRHVLEYAKTLDCVLLLDELDAIAKRRDDRGEIGELKRLVTVLLQQLDDWPSSGLLIAATNHAELLDPAVWRRFEEIVEFPLPSEAAAKSFILDHLATVSANSESWASVLAVIFKGVSFSEIDHRLKSSRRAAVLSGNGLDQQLATLINTATMTKQERIDLAVELSSKGLLSQRRAHELTGASRDTIRARAEKASAIKTPGRRTK